METLKTKLTKDTMILNFSDREMKKGLHTRHGFYSLNKRIKIGHADITGFY